MSNAEEVAKEITTAFPSIRPESFEPLVNSNQGDEPALTAAAFKDKDDWTALEWKWLDEAPEGMASALAFLSDKAACFYIPAYMVADVNGALKRVDPTYSLISGFDDYSRGHPIWPRGSETWTDYSTIRWSHLTRTQARAVARYLEWRMSLDDLGTEHGLAEALRSFWYVRAAGV